MLCFKFHQNRTLNEEFDFRGVKGVVLGRLEVAKVGFTSRNVYMEVIYHNKQYNLFTQFFLPRTSHIR